jgi:hypothetical protein
LRFIPISEEPQAAPGTPVIGGNTPVAIAAPRVESGNECLGGHSSLASLPSARVCAEEVCQQTGPAQTIAGKPG